MKKQQAGFTLVEISIVLVIIGLLLGGVLKGQELITNSKINRLVNDFNGMTSAIYSYQDRYGSIPGDDPGANARWGATNGNGNGVLAGGFNATGTEESRQLWDHLRESGLVAGDGLQQPNHAFGGIIGVEDAQYNMNGIVVCMSDVAGSVADIIDRRMDDGNLNQGRMRGANFNATAAPYAQNTSYTVCSQL